MDEAVVRGMARWPNVPAVYGWLALDARGNWLLRHPGDSARYERIGNRSLRDFIGRNYAADEWGRWYFQNGPQRVYARLERTPLVYRLGDSWEDHCGRRAGTVAAAWMDETGTVILQADRGVGVVDDRDLERLSRLFEAEDADGPAADSRIGMLYPPKAAGTAPAIPVGRIRSWTLPERFGFVADPAPRT